MFGNQFKDLLKMIIPLLISLFAYAFYTGHVIVIALGIFFSLPLKSLLTPHEPNPDTDNFVYLLRILVGAATLVCTLYYAWKDLLEYESGASVVNFGVTLVFILMLSIRLKSISESAS